jgi:plastocyanin
VGLSRHRVAGVASAATGGPIRAAGSGGPCRQAAPRTAPAVTLLACLATAAIGPVSAPAGMTVVKGTVSLRGGAFSGDLSAADAVVILHAPTAGTPAPGRATIDQRGRRFIPRVLVVTAGTTVDFPNNDDTHHNVNSPSPVHRFDLGLYPPGQTRSTTFEKPGVARIRCTAHPDMEAYVVVSDSPYVSAVAKDGAYHIDGVPAGTWEIEAWHPDLESVRKPVTVPADVPVLPITLDLRQRRAPP